MLRARARVRVAAQTAPSGGIPFFLGRGGCPPIPRPKGKRAKSLASRKAYYADLTTSWQLLGGTMIAAISGAYRPRRAAANRRAGTRRIHARRLFDPPSTACRARICVTPCKEKQWHCLHLSTAIPPAVGIRPVGGPPHPQAGAGSPANLGSCRRHLGCLSSFTSDRLMRLIGIMDG